MTTATGHRRAVAMGSLATLIAVATVYTTQPLLADIATGFGVPPVTARLAFFLPSLGYALAFFVFGPLSDRLPPRTMALAGSLVVAASVIAAAQVTWFTGFLVLMCVSGVAAAAIPSAMFALMPRVAAAESTATSFGFIIAASVAGITVGRSVGGLVAGLASWRTALVTMGIASLVATLLVAQIGSVAPAPATRGLAHAYAAALGLYRRPPVLRVLGMGACLFFGYLGAVTFLTLHLTTAPLGYSAQLLGSVSLVGLVAVVGAPTAGALVPRLGVDRVAIGGAVAALAGILILGVATAPAGVAAGLFVLFLGVFSCQPAALAHLNRIVPEHQRGTASSAYLLACLGSGSLASALLGPVWVRFEWAGITATAAGFVVLAIVLLRPGALIRRDTGRPARPVETGALPAAGRGAGAR